MEYILRSLRAAFSGAVQQVATVTRGIGVSGNSIQWRSFSILTPRAAAIKAYIALGVRIG